MSTRIRLFRLSVISLLFVCGEAVAENDFSQVFSLEWNSTWRTDVPYEVSIDAAKAGVPSKLQVYADGKALSTTLLTDDSRQEGIRNALTRPTVYRFSVPAGTKKIQMRPGKCGTVPSDVPDNMFAGASWRAGKYTRATKSSDGWLLESTDWKDGSLSCRVKVPEGGAGKPVVFEMDCMSPAKMTWGSQIYLKQYDAAGNLLPENVCDSRWTSLARPPKKMTPFRETGHIHPDAAEVELCVRLHAQKPEHDYYGLPIKDIDDARPQLLVSRLALRPAATLPFPKYDDSFFGKGVSGADYDNSLVFDGDRAFWYCTRSIAVWSAVSKYYQARTEDEIFFPSGDGTVEVWIKPAGLEEKNIVIFEAGRQYHKMTGKAIGPVLQLAYAPDKHTLTLLLVDKNRKKFRSSCKHTLSDGQWQHFAVTFRPGAEACLFVGGHKILGMPLEGYVPLDLKNDKYPNDIHASQLCIGASLEDASIAAEDVRQYNGVKYFKGEADLLRVSTGVRYSGDFTPSRSFTVDPATRALFDFNRSFDGVSGGGSAWISGTINAPTDRVDHVLTVGDRKVQYYPAEILDEFHPYKVFEPRVKEIPGEKEFAAADVRTCMSLDFRPGEKKTVKAPQGAYTDYVEIANTGDDVLLYPAVLRSDDIDARSYGDIAESLNVPGATDRQKANRFFNFLLVATDYYMTHQTYFDKDSDKPMHTDYNGMLLLNSYCGFECGPLNNVATTLFATAAACPANLLAGYGHQFEQVYFDGKNHHYDLSAQKFFPAMDNESAAGLGDSDEQEFIQRRLGASGSHFTRRSSRLSYGATMRYPEKFAISLNPGERIRFYSMNDGMCNDLVLRTSSQRGGKLPAEDYSETVHATHPGTSYYDGVLKIDKYFPEYGNGFLIFDGKPEPGNPAFKFVEKDSFCYDVKTPYPAVAAEYTATLKNGKAAVLELSTDGGKTFRPFTSPATYAVRARRGYLIRVCAPMPEVVNFKASTEVQVNSRIITGRLKPGDNEIMLKASAGTSAKVSYGLRTDGKPITFEGAAQFGYNIGCEKSMVVLEPSKGQMKVKVNGVGPKAVVVAAEGVTATVKNGILTLSSKDREARMGWVTVADGVNEKTLCVMVCDGARMARSGAELVREGDTADVRFAPVPAGEYKLYTLMRLPVDIKSLHTSNARLSFGSSGGAYSCKPINSTFDLYKDVMGPDGGRGVWRWDSPMGKEYSYPYAKPVVFKTEQTDSVKYVLKGKDAPLEISHVLIVPESGREFDNQIVKCLFGRNYRPWGVKR